MRGRFISKQSGKTGKIKSKCKKLFIMIYDHFYNILYAVMLTALWIYLICNWEKCVSMQFFSQFDGNNILFIAGLVLTILPFYDIEAKDIKLRRKSNKSMEDKYKSFDSKFLQEKLEQLQSENRINIDGGDEG